MNFVSGPINLVRLEGEIEGNKKVFYIFFDIHNDLYDQTECNDIKATNIKDLLVDKFSQTKVMYDYFLEIYTMSDYTKSDISKKNTIKYILNLSYMFGKSANFDYEKNKVLSSKEFPNVRFHFIDFRYFLYHHNDYYFGNIILDFEKSNTPESLKNIVDMINIIGAKHYLIYSILFTDEDITNKNHKNIINTYEAINKYSSDDMNDIIIFLINKIKKDYTKEKVKNNIHELFSNLKELYDSFFDTIILSKETVTKLIEIHEQYKTAKVLHQSDLFFKINEIKNKCFVLLSVLRIKMLYINVFLIDMYYLRRALDKDYTKINISYTGGMHSIHYIYVLVKYFDFRITNSAYINCSIDEATKKIKNTKKLFDDFTTNNEIVDIFDTDGVQCIDISNFPELFT